LEEVDTQKQQVLSQKTSLEAKRDQVQGTLDEQQSQADALMRRAELEKGDARLDLEKQAFAILQQRKDDYMQAQSLENQIDILNGELALIQVRFNGLTQSAQEIQNRIQEIETSSTRTALKQQLREVEGTISSNQQSLSVISAGISTGFRACRQLSDEACTMYEEAVSEFGKIRSNVKAHRNLLERLQGLLDSTDPVFVSAMQSKLPMQSDFGAEHKDKALTFFDQSVETYEKAAGMVSRLSGNLKPEDKSIIQDAKCSLLKSELLALYGKMQLADLTEAFDLANSTETAINELVQRGSELGVCFTQSETMRVVMNDGLNYLPSIPLNMEVFVEGKKQELSAWKRLPVSEQEPAVDNGILEIDSLIAQYGQEIAGQLEPLKQEMLAAKERGFQEPELGGGFSDPNSGF
jgi:predicted  nucleic acid-binding Zn-ribbon protein